MIQLLGLLLISLTASAGWENGNAGDTYAAEFKLTARDIVQRLDLLINENRSPAFDTRALRAAIATTTVTSEDRVYLDGLERDAVNYPALGLIKVGRIRWQELRRSVTTRDRMRLVAHEYLPITGVDDSDFAVSDRLIALIAPSNFNPDVWWNPVNPVNHITAKLAYPTHDCQMKAADLNVSSTSEKVDFTAEGQGCGDSYRRVSITKATGLTPPSSNVRGRFHKYSISVFDNGGRMTGEMEFEPEWGGCLLPDQAVCQASGKMTLGGVEFVFWFLRN